jgi:hypothetical protein
VENDISNIREVIKNINRNADVSIDDDDLTNMLHRIDGIVP